MSGKVFDLAHPFEFKGVTYDKLTARRPKVRDLRKFIKAMDRDSIQAMEAALGDLCELDQTVIAELDLEDFGPLKKWFEGFLKQMADESQDS